MTEPSRSEALSGVEIEADRLVAGYGGEPVLNGISLRVLPGDVLAILGPNGSGKSTLIRCLSRALRPTAGHVRIAGQDIFALSAREAARRVAVVPQHEDPVFDFTVREIVEMARYPWGSSTEPTGWRVQASEQRAPNPDLKSRTQSAVTWALEATACTELADRQISSLSGGERQRVLVTRALAQDTPVLLLDEPTAHMDVGYQIATLSLMRELAHQGRAIAAALHDLNLASAFANRAALLHGGRIVSEGPVEDVLQSEEIDRVYGTSFERIRDERTGRLILAPGFVPEEARAAHPRRVHLIGGGGSAAALLTELWQLGHRVSIGITHVSDSDYEAAKRLSIPYVAAPPFSSLSAEHRSEALALAADAEVVILCPAPFGPGNLENVALAEELSAQGKELWLMERRVEQWDFTGGAAEARIAALRSASVSSGEIASRLSTLPA